VRSLTSAASAACVSDQPYSTTRNTILRRPFRLSAALACCFIRYFLLGALGMVGTTQPPRRPGRNNVLRNYT
jgi:hypothetical protein